MRRGRWSQTVDEVTIYIPVDLILPLSSNPRPGEIPSATTSNSIGGGIERKKFDVRIQSTRVCIRSLVDPSSEFSDIVLTRRILPQKSTWYLTPGWLVLQLHKAPLTDDELDAVAVGGEWWDRVSEGDERIETLSCSVGADVDSLPQHAKVRAAREHARFQRLSEREQREELEALAGYKQVTVQIVPLMYVFNCRCNVLGILSVTCCHEKSCR